MANGLIMYVTAQTVRRQLHSPEARRQVADLLRSRGFDGVVIEGYRGGCVVPENELREVRDAFQAQGFDTLGGLMPVHGEGFGISAEGNELRLPSFCYSSEETVAALENVIRTSARLFRRVVIDDAFLTACRCGRCAANRRGRSWAVFRRDLLVSVAERWIAAARETRPDARLIVKFPQYYDRYHEFGYDPVRFPRIFDAVWQGTETRNPDTPAYGHVEPYEAYVNWRWMRECAGDKLECAWFDYLDCDEQLFYEQAVTTHLCAPKDITVFCYSEALVRGSMVGRVADALPVLRGLRDAAQDPVGVHVIKPPNSDGGRDLFLFDYLGMLGVPCVPALAIDSTMRSIIVPAHAAAGPGMAEAVRAALLTGRQVIATFDALTRMDVPLLELFGYDPKGITPGVTRVERFELGGAKYDTGAPCYISGDLAPVDAAVLAWATVSGCEAGLMRLPFITARTLATGGRAVVWNVGTFGADAFTIVERLNVPEPVPLLNLPKEVCDVLRAAATAPLGFTIKAPVRVATFLFRRHVVFVNYASVPAEIEVKGLPWRSGAILSDSANTACAENRVFLAPRSYAQIERAVAG